MASSFNYEWWTVRIKERTGILTWEFKGKNKDHIIKQIQKEMKKGDILEVYWDTLTLDRIGYQTIWTRILTVSRRRSHL